MSAPNPNPDGKTQEHGPSEKRAFSLRSVVGLDGLNFFLADVQTGLGPFLAIYLAGYHWSKEHIGFALTAGGIAGIVTQTPLGALVDSVKAKRSLIAGGVVALAVAAMAIASLPRFWPVIIAESSIGAVSSVFAPAIAAITLGLVGVARFDRRTGRNQGFNSAGNVVAALAMGAIGYWVSNRGIFFFVAAMAIPTLSFLGLINPAEIDHQLARGGNTGGQAQANNKNGGSIKDLLRDKNLLLFLVCAVLFHFANAAMLPLLGEKLSDGKGKSSMLFMSACVITTQLVITLIAGVTGRLAGSWGRKPLLLIAFAVLPIRGLLYTLFHQTAALVSIQVLDGIGAGIFGVVSLLVIADLTRGSGRFNLAQGAVATAVGIGASLSQSIAGSIVQHSSYRTAFLFLAAVAVVALGLFWVAVPETKSPGNPDADGPTPESGEPKFQAGDPVTSQKHASAAAG